MFHAQDRQGMSSIWRSAVASPRVPRPFQMLVSAFQKSRGVTLPPPPETATQLTGGLGLQANDYRGIHY